MEFGWVVYGPESCYDFPDPRLLRVNPWSPGGSFMVQKVAITSPIPRLLRVNPWSPGGSLMDHKVAIT